MNIRIKMSIYPPTNWQVMKDDMLELSYMEAEEYQRDFEDCAIRNDPDVYFAIQAELDKAAFELRAFKERHLV